MKIAIDEENSMKRAILIGVLTISLIVVLLSILLGILGKNEKRKLQKSQDEEIIKQDEIVFRVEAPDVLIELTSDYEFIFFNEEHKQVGKLSFSGEKMIFEGDVDVSAEQFFKVLLDKPINPYLESTIK